MGSRPTLRLLRQPTPTLSCLCRPGSAASESRLGRVIERRDLLHLLATVVADEHVPQRARLPRVQADAGVEAGVHAEVDIATLLRQARTPTRHRCLFSDPGLSGDDVRLKTQ